MMAAPASKKIKRTMPIDIDPDTEVLEFSPDTSAVTSSRRCIICGNKTSNKIKKDHNFDAMMQLYWCSLGVDVKPQDCNKSNICGECFDKVMIFFETNDIIAYFETYFKSLRLELLKKTLKGISSLEKQGRELSQVHKDIIKQYGDKPDITEPEEEQLKQTLNTYSVETVVKDEASRTIRLNKHNDQTNGSEKKDVKKQTIKISLKTSPSKTSKNEEGYSTDSVDSD